MIYTRLIDGVFINVEIHLITTPVEIMFRMDSSRVISESNVLDGL